MLRKVKFIASTRGVRALIRGISRVLLRTVYVRVLNKRYARIKVFNFKLCVDLFDEGISRTLWLYGERELDHKWIMDQVIWPGARVLDVGANIGYYAVMESLLVGSGGQIVAVEPSPENYRSLNKNIRLNNRKNIVSECLAVSDKTELREFFLARESNLNTFYKPILQQRGNLAGSISVETLAFSDVVSKHGEFDFLRMDIEGHEVFVLKDILSFAKEGRKCPDVIFEAHINAYGPNQDIAPVLRGLSECGYRVAMVASSNPNGTKIIESMGRRSIKRIVSDETVRTIHKDLAISELIECITNTGGIRTVYLKAPA